MSMGNLFMLDVYAYLHAELSAIFSNMFHRLAPKIGPVL